jgi:hypothetical protein
MDFAYRTPLLDCFRRGEVPRDIRMLAARGALAPRAQEQLALLVLLVSDTDAKIAAVASQTLDSLPKPALAKFLRRSDLPDDLRTFFAARGVTPDGPIAQAVAEEDPLIDVDSDDLLDEDGEVGLDDVVLVLDESAEGGGAAEGDVNAGDPAKSDEVVKVEEAVRVRLSSLPVPKRLKLALKGTREQRSVLIRDPNKIIAAAVLSSPKLSETEVEAFSRMTNVSEDVLRTIGMTRAWTRSYAVASGLVRNPKTPPAISMPLMTRMNDRDIRLLSTDRNVPEALRLNARKMMSVADSRKK